MRLGVMCRVQAADVDETRLGREAPRDMTMRLAALKAQTVLGRLAAMSDSTAAMGSSGREVAASSGGAAALVVLGGDTAVAIGDEIFGKPRDAAHAIAMLMRLSGHTHTVFSAVAVAAAGRRMGCMSATEVTFHHLEQPQVEAYCRTTEPFDKAGGYGIQGAAGGFVRCINGSYSGAVGLPMWETWRLLRAFAAASGR